MDVRDSREYAAYETTISVLRKLLRDGLITDDEYRRMEQYFAQKYGLEFSIIYR